MKPSWLALLLAGCATVAPVVSNHGDAPEIGEMKARFPEFYATAHARIEQEFHGREVAARSQLGPGRWRTVIQLDVDPLGDVHGVKLLRSSGFNAIDDEALAAGRRVKEHLFPPEGAVESDNFAHLPVQLIVEVPTK